MLQYQPPLSLGLVLLRWKPKAHKWKQALQSAQGHGGISNIQPLRTPSLTWFRTLNRPASIRKCCKARKLSPEPVHPPRGTGPGPTASTALCSLNAASSTAPSQALPATSKCCNIEQRGRCKVWMQENCLRPNTENHFDAVKLREIFSSFPIETI